MNTESQQWDRTTIARIISGAATHTEEWQRISDAHNAELAAERQRGTDEERQRWQNVHADFIKAVEARERVKSQLLSALAAIEKHNIRVKDFSTTFGAKLTIEVDRSLLHEHDAEVELKGWHKGFADCEAAGRENKERLIAEVRKPLVDLLIKCRRHLDYTKFLKHEIDDMLAKAK